MEELIALANSGIGLGDVLLVISACVAVAKMVDQICKKIMQRLQAYYNKRKGVEETDDTIEMHTQELKELSKKLSRTIDVMSERYDLLIQKLDEQHERMIEIDQAGQKRDRALLRDRIIGGMRYFGQNVDADGHVHIGIKDHENLEGMFQAYFSCGGNGNIRKLYTNEFKAWIIDL